MKDKTKSRRYAIEAKCYDCTGGYIDGRKDCENPKCPLYTFMPYRRNNPDTSWVEWPGRVQRNLSDDQRAARGKHLSRRDRTSNIDSTDSGKASGARARNEMTYPLEG